MSRSICRSNRSFIKESGGKLIIPPRLWFTRPIINLHPKIGADIHFSGNEKLYSIVETSFEGLVTYSFQSPLSAI